MEALYMRKKISLLIFVLLTPSLFAHGNYSLYKNNDKYGLINKNKKIVLEAEYDSIKFNDVYLCIKKGKESYVYDQNMKFLHIFSSEQQNIMMCLPTLFYFSMGERIYTRYYLYNLLDNKTSETRDYFIDNNKSSEPWIAGRSCFYSKYLKPQADSYDRVYPYREKRAVVLNHDWQEEIIDENFNVVIQNIYASADYFSEGLIPVIMEAEGSDKENKIPGESCYLDINGKVVHKCDFDFNHICRDTISHVQTLEVKGSFNEGIAVVQKADKSWIILDREFNKYYLPEGCIVESYSYSNGFLLVSKKIDDKTYFGFIDKQCNVAIPFEYTYAESFDGLYAIVKKDGIFGVIDTQGNFTSVDELER